MAPAHGNGAPAASVPDTSSAPRDWLAPPATMAIAAVDAPPIMLSVEVCQPLPNSALTSPASNSLTSPVVVDATAAVVAAVAFVRSSRTPRFQTATMSRVAVMSAVGSPETSTRSARSPGAMRPRSRRL